ncbi:MAG: PAS domain S-box protein, partial [Syntrophobacteraceae bacterium]
LTEIMLQQSMILDNSPLGISRIVNRKQIWVNRRTEEMFQYPKEELLGQTTRKLHPSKESYERVGMESSPILAQGLIYETEHEMMRRDGSSIWVRYHGKAVDPHDMSKGTIWVLEDVTENRKIKQQLSESEDRYKRLVNNAPDILYRFTDKLDGVYCSPRAEAILGYTPTELCERPALWFDSIHPDDRPKVEKAIADLPDRAKYDLEYRIIDRYGRWHWFHDRAIGSVTDGGAIIIEGLASDITERKRAEEERKQLEHRMQQAHKAESLGRMAGAIAHHFNNMIGAVIGNLELALTDLPQLPGVRLNITEAMKASQRAAEISRLMLTYIGQTIAQRELLDLAEAAKETHALVKASLPENVHINTSFPSPGPIILADGAHIKQILTNLVLNAGEAIGEKEGDITMAIRVMSAAQIRGLKFFPSEWEPKAADYACFSISDNGSGMDATEQEKIFDPFFTTKFIGRGLGLAIVLGLVRAHDGAIAVESAPGLGSVFQVLLPMHTAQALPSKEETTLISRPLEDMGSVLVVDDEPMLRIMAQAMLEKLGIESITACDGNEAMEIFHAHKDEIRLVLLDLSMPGMDGWETLAALRALRPDLPVVLVSGYDEAQVMQSGHPERPQAFVHKPYTLADLKAALAQALNAPPVADNSTK